MSHIAAVGEHRMRALPDRASGAEVHMHRRGDLGAAVGLEAHAPTAACHPGNRLSPAHGCKRAVLPGGQRVSRHIRIRRFGAPKARWHHVGALLCNVDTSESRKKGNVIFETSHA